MKKFQGTFSMMRWFDAQGGHLETRGLSIDRDVIEIPEHRHHVKLNIFRVDVGLKYHLNSQWMLEANIPYETKTQEATIEEFAESPLTPSEWKAAERNRNIHHRNETYMGPTDSDVLLGYRTQGVLTENDFLMARIGTTIPFGKTEENPWILGDKGLKHLHIQFGTGTFNPITDLHYSLAVYKGLGVNASARGKFPFYENSKTYRGSRELTYTAGLNYRLNNWFSFQSGYLGSYKSFAYWAGDVDKNTGLLFGMASFGASIRTPYNIPLSLTVTLPLHQKTLYDDSAALRDGKYQERDAFEFGPLVSLTALYAF